MDKKGLRKEVRARVAMLDNIEKETRSIALCGAFYDFFACRSDKVVALFSPLPDEVRLWTLVERLACLCKVVLPRVEGDTMQFYTYNKGGVKLGAFGIMEPQGKEPVLPEDIDVVLVPGVAFALNGARMGRGKGYYDKYMSQPGFRALKIGVCYKEQLLDSLPVEEHDVSVHRVVDC